MPPRTVRIAAVGDLHCGRNPQSPVQPLFVEIGAQADALVLCGDLTDHGTPDEARALAKDLASLKVPVVAVLGNHDFEAGKPDEVRKILLDAGACVLDGESCEFHGIGFAGVKGFCGGFGPRALAPWGEEIVKRFVHEAVDEALKLESALARLRSPYRIAVLHYAPVQATVEGEPCDIFPFLGSSRLEEPLLRYPVHAVIHGHAHSGTLEGRTRTDVPVYNVARPLLERMYPGRPGFRVIEIEPDVGAAGDAAGGNQAPDLEASRRG